MVCKCVVILVNFGRNHGMCSGNGDDHLFKRDTAGQQFDEISGPDDSIRVKCFPGGMNSHAAFNQVHRRFNVLTGSIFYVRCDHIPSKREPYDTITIMIPKRLTTSANAFSTSGQHSFRYASLYLGKRVAKLLSSSRPCRLSSLVKEGSFHPSGTVSNSDSFTSHERHFRRLLWWSLCLL